MSKKQKKLPVIEWCNVKDIKIKNGRDRKRNCCCHLKLVIIFIDFLGSKAIEHQARLRLGFRPKVVLEFERR